ncbi:MAG: HNH endonuclease [Micromonosporaceae bacterium]|nr:HNH endonuclease [Micromonosporaceae bacterium]
MTGYSRDRFHHWQSQGDGCDTRDRVLQRDGQGVVTGDDCRITAGTWFSVYDGQTLTDPSDLDIDHVVPLANAWRTGAAAWTDEQRAAFANDLQRPQLIAVSSSSNRSKGDQDPSQWKPPRREYWCTYAQSWIAVKAYWHLSVTADEKAALAEMLGTCT